MQLLFKRDQKAHAWTGRTQFKLWAKCELDTEEQDLIAKFKMDNATLIDVPQPGLIRNCFLLGFVSFLLLVPFIAFNFWREIGLGWVGVVCISAVIALIVGFIAYHQLRETIYVKDLMHGRQFKCRSVIELARKEAYLQAITGYFRQVVESAKQWGGTESFEIKPLEAEDAKRAILSGPLL